jgi:hypothetical protein
MYHRRIAVLIFGVLVLAVPLAGPVVATPTVTTTVADPLEQASVRPTPCAAADEGAIFTQAESCVRAGGVCGCRADSADDPIIAPRQAR